MGIQIPITLELSDSSTVEPVLALDPLDTKGGKPTGVTLVPAQPAKARFFGTQEVVQLVLSVSGTVSVGLLTNWLYDRLIIARPRRVTIDRQIVEFNDKGHLERIIRERVREE